VPITDSKNMIVLVLVLACDGRTDERADTRPHHIPR